MHGVMDKPVRGLQALSRIVDLSWKRIQAMPTKMIHRDHYWIMY